VGEWLTRHILSGFSGLDEEQLAAAALDRRLTLDSWDLPQSGARDSEDMLARVGRSETESDQAWRRIEDQLRGIGHRLESSERSHSESNRFLSRTAQEINSNARQQAQAFEQLGDTICGLRERLERLERSAAGDNIRQAIKALHQGLSRLADQLTITAGNSAGQLAQVTANLEKLASHVGKVWEDADNSAQLLNQRIDLTHTELAQQLKDNEHAFFNGLSATEKTVQFATNALDHALEKIEAAAGERAAELEENQRRSHAYEENLRELKESLAELEARLPGLKLESRLNAIERSVGGLKETMAQPAHAFDNAVQDLSQRLERLERDHVALIEELRAGIAQEAIETGILQQPSELAEEVLPQFSALEPASVEVPLQEPVETLAPPPLDDEIIFADQEFEPRKDTPEIEPFADFDGAFAEPEPDDILAQARRSALEAMERAEGERLIRLSSFRADPLGAEREEKARSKYLLPALAASLVVMFTVAALMLSHRERISETQLTAANTANVPLPSSAPPVSPTETMAGGADNDHTAEIAPARDDTRTETVATPPESRKLAADRGVSMASQSAPRTSDRVAQLANAGNPVALAIIGLKALDGGAGTAVNLPEAVKYLSQAADKGQAVAQYRMGTLYERGQGVAADPVKAMRWYEMAANQGNRKAMHNLAVAYASGPAAKRNMTEAARWFAKAAALGLADSQFNLAVLYERGEGVSQSLTDAYKWYAVAALSGDAEAKSRMAVLATQIGESDRSAAGKSAASFRAAPLVRSVNVPPEPGDLGT